MDEDECGFLLLSQRECSALGLNIRTAMSKGEVTGILRAYEPESGEDFDRGFPHLAKVVRDLPDESPPAP
ncbi:hypothetical protein ABZT16_16845 [Streptomyces flaveolus]|uniref:hypothetical protein n=1 Tax=Streptomyces flaveolus TaxID=67297 RepID=UPI0033A8FA2F